MDRETHLYSNVGRKEIGYYDSSEYLSIGMMIDSQFSMSFKPRNRDEKQRNRDNNEIPVPAETEDEVKGTEKEKIMKFRCRTIERRWLMCIDNI